MLTEESSKERAKIRMMKSSSSSHHSRDLSQVLHGFCSVLTFFASFYAVCEIVCGDDDDDDEDESLDIAVMFIVQCASDPDVIECNLKASE
jgi:hypothetical protein